MALALEDRMLLSLVDSANAFADQIERSIAKVGNEGPGITHALQMFGCYARAIVREAEQSWDDAPTPQFKIASLQMLNQHIRDRVELFDRRFARGHAAALGPVAALVERECERHGATDVEAVLTVGPPGNFSTFVGDLRATLFREIQADPELPEHLEGARLLMIMIPELEGTQASRQPIVVGHEVAHYLQTFDPVISGIGLDALLDKAVLAATSDELPAGMPRGTSRTRALEQIAARWLNELICDAHAVHRTGAAGLAALSEYLQTMGAGNVASRTHPPACLRTSLMFGWLSASVTDSSGQIQPARLTDVQEEIAGPFRDLGREVTQPDWAAYLANVLTSLAPQIKSAVAAWTTLPAYGDGDRDGLVEKLATLLADGIPGAEQITMAGSLVDVLSADVVNACWLALHRRADTPVNRLTLKALDTLNFLDQWLAAGGQFEREVSEAVGSTTPGALTRAEICDRLDRTDVRRLAVTPRMPGSVKGTSIDLRLGNRFIVFERPMAAAFDALDPAQDPRSMQDSIYRAWGDVFYLHPGQLVLASTLEYICLPGDLTAHVITRSSYGRLGLISATAVQVHPNFAGCLTLELVNLGEIPMAVTPGERIAQLMLFTTTSIDAPTESGDKYRYPTGPEFSKVRDDQESQVLRRMRQRFDARAGRRPL